MDVVNERLMRCIWAILHPSFHQLVPSCYVIFITSFLFSVFSFHSPPAIFGRSWRRVSRNPSVSQSVAQYSMARYIFASPLHFLPASSPHPYPHTHPFPSAFVIPSYRCQELCHEYLSFIPEHNQMSVSNHWTVVLSAWTRPDQELEVTIFEQYTFIQRTEIKRPVYVKSIQMFSPGIFVCANMDSDPVDVLVTPVFWVIFVRQRSLLIPTTTSFSRRFSF